MRLADLKAVELTRTLPEVLTGEPPDWRVVAYVPEQQPPVYISEARRPQVVGSKSISKFNDVSLGGSPLRHSFRLALQLWVGSGQSWTIDNEWVVDLRHVRRQKLQAVDAVVLHSDDGPMVPGALVPENTVGSSKASSIMTAQSETKPLSHGFASMIFGWGNGASSRLASANASIADPEKDTLTSLSYPTLVDLWALKHSLDDARAASSAVSEEIDQLVVDSILPFKHKEATLVRRLELVRKQTRVAREKAGQTRSIASERRQEMTAVSDSLINSVATARKAVGAETTVYAKVRSGSKERAPDISKEQARLAAQILQVFPIDPVESARFHFTIRGLALPSVFAINHFDPVQVGAALGYVAQVVVLLSQYLDVALPYPITVYGSQSFIADNISAIKHGSNKFPLWTRGALLYRVEYALYLLHKDIEQLMNAVDLAVADLKQTLANLKNLLLVISLK